MALIGIIASTAHADAIPPAYSITDLGAGDARLATDAGGDGILIAPDGRTTYAFPRTENALTNPQAVLQSFPPFTNAPVDNPMTYGNPNNAYSEFSRQGLFLTRDGEFVGTDVYGVSGHVASAGSTVLSARRQADGSFGPLTPLWGSPNNNYTGGPIAQALDINVRNEILGVASHDFSNFTNRSFLLYDLDSKASTELGPILPGWHLDSAVALDDRGRILVTADSNATDGQAHSLLLTPAGELPDPSPVPEPSALATLLLGLAGMASRLFPRRQADGRLAAGELVVELQGEEPGPGE
jgi:hypothetical protein